MINEPAKCRQRLRGIGGPIEKVHAGGMLKGSRAKGRETEISVDPKSSR